MEDQSEETKMSLTEHLLELRNRLTRALIAVGVGFLGCWYFRDYLFDILTRPLINALPDKSYLIFTGLTQAFFTYMKISFFASVILTSPLSSIRSGNSLRRRCCLRKKSMSSRLCCPPPFFFWAAFHSAISWFCLPPSGFLSASTMNISKP